MNISKTDRIQALTHGISENDLERQISLLEGGVRNTLLLRPATIGDGIVRLSEQEKRELADQFRELSRNLDVVKFIPASGAATRMFRDLYGFVETGTVTATVQQFFDHIHEFAFHEKILAERNYPKDPREQVLFLLGEKGFNFGQLPKGLLPFHRDEEKIITPIESHINEATSYSDLKDGSVAVHFTLSPEHLHEAEKIIWNSVFELEEKFGIESSIHLSEQDASTDTIALVEGEELLRDEKGSLIFRPGGHGSLIKNLQETDADIVFIRNIDNILPPKRNTETVFYKKVLGAYLIQFQIEIHSVLRALSDGNSNAVAKARKLIAQYFGIQKSDSYSKQELISFLNRPIRVAGMVKNEGEPGGGPFWVLDENGKESLQIVEAVQVGKEIEQQEILKNATHFNPVDLVCSIKDYKGEKFVLNDYVDFSSSLIVEKSIQGKKVKGLEHPGLWNGSMAKWLTVFIEIPVSTFNPVKTINDLLKERHKG